VAASTLYQSVVRLVFTGSGMHHPKQIWTATDIR
jgi:hypothetical protein